MGVIRVTATELRAKAEDLAGLNSNLKASVRDLEAYEQNLTSMWEGEANKAFHQAFHSDKSQMEQFGALVDKYVAVMQEIAAKYAQAENINVSTASNRSYS